MATRLYRIDRYDRTTNEITKKMVEVERAQRDFSYLNPFSSKRRKLVREVKRILAADAQTLEDEYQRRLDAMSPSDRAVHESLEELGSVTFAPESNCIKVRRNLRKHGNRTLQAIVDQFGSGRHHDVTELLAKHDDTGPFLREVITFHEVLGSHHASTSRDMLNDVRLCQKRFRREDLTELGEKDRAEVMALLAVALELDSQSNNIGNHALSSASGHLNYGLSRVVCENTHRTQDIIDYIKLHDMTAEKISSDHLTAYLENPTRSLGAGVL